MMREEMPGREKDLIVKETSKINRALSSGLRGKEMGGWVAAGGLVRFRGMVRLCKSALLCRTKATSCDAVDDHEIHRKPSHYLAKGRILRRRE